MNRKDFFSGLMFMGMGIAFAAGSTTYKIGSGGQMGPGYFPLILGVILALIGLAVTAMSLRTKVASGDPIGPIAWRPLCFIIAANLVFGVSIGGLPSLGLAPLGLIVGIVLLTFIAALAGDGFHWREVALLAAILAMTSYLAFVALLKLQFPVWPAFFAS